MISLRTYALIVIIGLHGFAAAAESQVSPSNDANTPGGNLALRVFSRPDGIDASSIATMTLTLANGLERQRTLSTFRRDIDDGEQVLIRFHTPANIRGTGLLVDTVRDSIWLFLPALDRTRRISTSNRGGRFVQSQIYYEDLQRRHPRDDVHELLEAATYEGVPTLILESTPIDLASSVYTKRVSWIHPDVFVPLRVDFYEGEDTPSKRLEVLRLDEVQGYWTVTDSIVTDLERGDSTRMTVDSIRYDIDLADSLFTASALASPEADPKPPVQ